MHATLPVSICEVQTANGLVAYVTLVPAGEAVKRGLVAQEIIGQLLDATRADRQIDPANFARNRAFVDFLHEAIQKHAPALPNLIDAAKAQGMGWVYIIDGRTPTPQGAVPPEDVIGGFQVDDGEILDGSYRANPNHRILSQRGFFQLDPDLERWVLADLAAHIERSLKS
ncbi:hypothetical protein [Dyella mobilis]|uniref:Uncharacterized protein n=1 Tax=Dyella mobilis TaxID=1849582 RepID=A0ABS2KHN8_9GAMM|nr:hypothetical protein [Dyella mobilis]MBM7130683.1 hypothetical protein [Dyella mobilis]GLQ97306.1 hypothetical protein GCM10007863_17260 [Dyella mobilis]